MAASDTTSHRLTDTQLQEALALIKDADSVELKLTVPDASRRSAVTALDMDPLEGQIRQVFFFDTPGLDLNARGIVVRARRVQGRGDDTVIKLRPVIPADLPEHLRTSPSMVVEVDAMPGGYVCSASLRGDLGSTGAVKDAVTGGRPVRKLFTKEQRRFYADHAPEGLGIDDLSVLGPINVFKLKFSPPGYDRKMVAELWLYPDGSRVVELSTKCSIAEPFQVATEARAYLTGKGIDLEAEQQTKTRTALEFFASELAAD
jgi:hypothetical protein